MNIKTILMDLDDTILDFKKSEAAALSETMRQIGLDPTPELIAQYSEINDSFWKRLERGEVTREELLVRRFEALFEKCGIKGRTGEETHRIYEYQLSQQVHFVDGAIDLLEKLYRDFDLYIVSNGTAVVQDSRIQKAGLEKYFKKIFVSQRIGYNKPNIAFFEGCFAEIPNLDLTRTIIVGDSLSSDIAGGIAAGIRTCWYNPKGLAAPDSMQIDWVIHDLAQIPDILNS